ncbi:MAG TPA: aminotransferase class V-fold PLP-dependent enzyme [Terriglobia bacterium]|nr:aminotransferase class V-fold PLP-dependent enzyme [Terriglobia bacterium]
MGIGIKWNRRWFLGGLGAAVGSLLSGGRLPAAGSAASEHAASERWPDLVKVTGFGSTGNVYEELGVAPLINGVGTLTMVGGSLIPPEVETVMGYAAQHFVSIPDLEVAAGKKIAEMLKLPSGYTGLVTSGAAGAITCGYAGVLTADNEEFIRQLPDLTGMKSEVIIQKSHRYPFDHQIRATGVKLVEIETREDLRKAVSPRTAMMHFTNYLNSEGQIKVDEWVKLSRQYQLPCFNDAAADTPPISRLWEYVNMGYDLVAFSGGKDIRGPQCAGLLLGREDLIHYALLNNSPYEDTIGRGQKIGKEEIVGMVKALELFLASDQKAMLEQYWHQLDEVASVVNKIPGVSTAYHYDPNQIANNTVGMDIFWDPRRISLTSQEAAEELLKGKPSIMLGAGRQGGGLSLSAWQLRPGEEKIIARRLAEVLRAHRIAS